MSLYSVNPPIFSLDDLSEESRIIATPWSRMVRGIGLGQNPVGYESTADRLITRSINLLYAKVGEADSYTNFSFVLVNAILSVVRSGLKKGYNNFDIFKVITAFRKIENPYFRAIAGTIILDSIAKLNINNHMENIINDLACEILKAVDEIQPDAIHDENQGRHGDYERVSAYTAVFFSFRRIGISHLLNHDGRDRVLEALSSLKNVPTPFFCGRGGSMLIASIALIGREDAIEDNYIVEYIFGGMDRVEESQLYPAFPSPMSIAFIKIYPLLTMLNAISTLNKSELYLQLGRDRLEEADILMNKLSPVECTHMALYYVMGLMNLGLLDKHLPDINSFVEKVVGYWSDINPGSDYFLSGIAYAYIVQLAYFTGRADLISDNMIDRMVGAFRDLESTSENRANRPYPFSYALNVLAELGLGEVFHTPHPAYDNQEPYDWVIEHLSDGGREESGRLYMLNHALISWALRLREPEC